MLIYALIIAFFAAVWMVGGVSALPSPLNLFGVLLAIASSVCFVFVMITDAKPHHSELPAPNWTPYGIAVAFEAIAIPISIGWLHGVNRSAYIMPAVAGIVGIHFFGLVPAFHSIRFLLIGLCLCSIPIGTISLLPQKMQIGGAPVALWQLVIGVGCAFTLWLGALIGR